jgi:argininosuccinate lyase
VFQEDIFKLLTPQASVEGRKSPGGTAPGLVAKRVAQLTKGRA